jgi:hypothetical protein
MTEPPAEANLRSHRASWLALTILGGIVALVALQPGLRSLAGDTWRELRTISVEWLAIIILARIGQAIFSAVCWRNALTHAFPRFALPFRFMLGLDQGQDALNTLTPARGGTITMIAALRLTIRGATTPKLLAVLAIQNLPFLMFGLLLAAVLAIGLPDRIREENTLFSSAADFVARHPVWSWAIFGVVIVGVLAALYLMRSRIDDVRNEVREGLALLGTPIDYIRLVVAPAFISYLFRWLGVVALLGAFGIPVTFWTAALAIGSSAAGGAVRVTPGGVGPSQALDVIALSAYAPAETVTAFSLANLAVSAVVSTSLALVGLLTGNRRRGIYTVMRARRKARAG